ncbi:hypothetical protein [Streptomyces sp. NPDC049879]|uniref:hypothetical protein n=1 Tax=Streptomyces sp. NPDC049879 TaxID=3365598 RepID=UPI0037B16DF3
MATEAPGQRVLDLLDKAIGVQAPLARGNIARARRRNPDATPAEVIRDLERTYVRALTGAGAAVGGTAAVPGIGTGVALSLSAGESLTTLGVSSLFVLSLAEIHGVPVDELERRRTIVMGIMLGETGSATVAKAAGRTGRDWGRQVVGRLPAQALRRINKALAKRFIARYGTRQAAVVLGRAAPFGIGAVIGGSANAAIATATVRAGRRAFGPPPEAWPEPGDPLG